MPQYDFKCDVCDIVHSTTRRMSESGEPFSCLVCGGPTHRVFSSPAVTFHCDGFHNTDYGRGNATGTKNDRLNRAWSKYYNEPPPPPATDLKRNSGEPV